MLVISTRNLIRSKNKFFEIAHNQKVIVKRKNRFFQLIDLGETLPELDNLCMSKEQLYAKIDNGIEEYKQGKAKKLDVQNINSFLGL
jgi:hypothetical protein